MRMIDASSDRVRVQELTPARVLDRHKQLGVDIAAPARAALSRGG